MTEVWRDILGYEGLYQISNQGNVLSLSFGARNIRKSNKHKLLKSTPNNCGYHKVELYKDGKSKIFYVHRLVASTFIPNPRKLPQINHKDGDKANNTVDNLEWVSASDNQKHAIALGLRPPSNMLGRTGELSPNSKKVIQYDKQHNLIAKWDSIADASRHFGVNPSCISNTLAGRQKTCLGCLWEYAN